MVETAENPYAPPAPVEIQLDPVGGSRPIAICAAIGTVAFLAFTVLLLQSAPLDQKVGFAFLANSVLLVGLTVASYRSTRVGTFFGVAATIVQLMIMLVLLAIDGTDTAAVLQISASVIVPLSFITLWAWRLSTGQRLRYDT